MIYLSNFTTAGKDNRAVSIAAITPRGFKGEVRKDLAPSVSLFRSFKKNEITMEQFISEYCLKIYDMDLEKLAADLDGKVLLCYCDKNQFCHRTLLGLILHAELDIEVEEVTGFAELNQESYDLKENPMVHRPSLDFAKKYGFADLLLSDAEKKKQGFYGEEPVLSNKWLEMKQRGLSYVYTLD
jgi:uncharacterized protein YeaO (DUF488 family)